RLPVRPARCGRRRYLRPVRDQCEFLLRDPGRSAGGDCEAGAVTLPKSTGARVIITTPGKEVAMKKILTAPALAVTAGSASGGVHRVGLPRTPKRRSTAAIWVLRPPS